MGRKNSTSLAPREAGEEGRDNVVQFTPQRRRDHDPGLMGERFLLRLYWVCNARDRRLILKFAASAAEMGHLFKEEQIAEINRAIAERMGDPAEAPVRRSGSNVVRLCAMERSKLGESIVDG